VQAALAAEDAAWCSEPQAVPAGTSRLRRPAGHDWIAAGDAALASDPLSGAGLEQALVGGLGAARACEGMLAGHAGAADAYAAASETAWHDMLAARAEAYARETRWPWSPFWARRHVARQATGAVA
jgi:flavin-dependent dehydrogenase